MSDYLRMTKSQLIELLRRDNIEIPCTATLPQLRTIYSEYMSARRISGERVETAGIANVKVVPTPEAGPSDFVRIDDVGSERELDMLGANVQPPVSDSEVEISVAGRSLSSPVGHAIVRSATDSRVPVPVPVRRPSPKMFTDR